MIMKFCLVHSFGNITTENMRIPVHLCPKSNINHMVHCSNNFKEIPIFNNRLYESQLDSHFIHSRANDLDWLEWC